MFEVQSDITGKIAATLTGYEGAVAEAERTLIRRKPPQLADAAMRCVLIHDDPAAPKTIEDCVGKYEYMPDGSWKGAGTCTDTYKGGDKVYVTWEEGSHLKEYVYKKTGGTGKYEGRQRRGHLYVREPDRHDLGRQSQRHRGIAVRFRHSFARPRISLAEA